MPEIPIQRTNFFDGQFLKQGEFLDLDTYHLHMRRRWAFVLFSQSGVVQTGATDLQIQVPNAAQKILVVQAGMAIGRRPDLAEAKEIVLSIDTQPIDLTVVGPSVPTPLVAGNTGFVTVHYEEEPVAIPPSEGDVAGNTRIREHARITVHNTVPGATAPNGEPFIRLGDVTFNTMAVNTAARQTAFLNAALLAPLPQISLNPSSVPATGVVPVTMTASGGLNLTGATVANVSLSPPANGVTFAVSNVQAGSLTLTLTLTNAAVGPRTVTVNTNASASAQLTIQTVTPPPTLNAVNGVPATATRNQLMTINGTNFIAPVTVTFTGGAIVGPNFNGPGESLSQGQIILRVPGANANTGPITVSALGGTVQSASTVVIL